MLEDSPLIDKSILVVGIGGLGCPALWALAESGLKTVVLCDDDEVALSNLHRQLLFGDADVGSDKLSAAAKQLAQLNQNWHVELRATRFLPENALALASSVDLILEGADNFATKFLVCDAAFLAGKPVVHGAGIRWSGTVFSVAETGRPCYRCLFEDVPSADVGLNCDSAGVMGPVLGITGALMADRALRVLSGDTEHCCSITTYDGKRDRLRDVPVYPREDCPLCGNKQRISDIDEARYLAPSCAA
jgi:adenylyltransferase/sulfurtransferase